MNGMEFATDVTAHFTAAMVVVHLIEMLKKAQWFPMLRVDTKVLNRFVSLTLAFAAAVGINWTFDVQAGTLVITGLTWPTVLAAGWETLKQYCAQQALYAGTVEARPVKLDEKELEKIKAALTAKIEVDGEEVARSLRSHLGV